MSLSRLFWWIYQLSPGVIVLAFAACTLVFLWLYRRLRELRWVRGLLISVLMIWLAAAVYATLLNRSRGTVGAFQTIPLHSYREMCATGNREILRSNFMNVALFYPAGLLLGAILPKNGGQRFFWRCSACPSRTLSTACSWAGERSTMCSTIPWGLLSALWHCPWNPYFSLQIRRSKPP